MAKKISKVAGIPGLDPTLPSIPLKLGGRTYHLCFDFASLALAEAKLREKGVLVNMLHALDFRGLDAGSLPIVLFAALLRENPALTFQEVQAMVTVRQVPDILDALHKAYEESIAEPSKEPAPNPPLPE